MRKNDQNRKARRDDVTPCSDTGCNSPVYIFFSDRKPDRNQAITIGTQLLSEGKAVDELLIADLLDTGRYKRNAAKQAIHYLQRHFASQVRIEKNGGVVVLVPVEARA
jgi:hypothetical protein